MTKKRALVIGWDAAEWEVVHPLIDAGKLPTLARLVETGSSGRLTGLAPFTETIAWTSLATGRFAEHHGVTGYLELRPDRGGLQPIGKRSWRAPAFWEVLSSAGFETAVINWAATTPADHWAGIMVDDEFALPAGDDFETWPLPPHSVSPQSLRSAMRNLRVHPREIGMDELAEFVPRAAEIDQKRDRRLAKLAISLARTASVHAAATHLAEVAQWDMLAVRYTLLADVKRDIATGTANAANLSAAYEGTVATVYRLLDMMVARLLSLAGPETSVFLVAPYTHPESPVSVADTSISSGVAHPQDMLIVSGTGTVPDALIQGATICDLCPSILKFFGLAVESDGRALDECFSGLQPAPRKIAIPLVPPGQRADPAVPLLAMGYADRLNAKDELAIVETELVSQRNLGDHFLARGEWGNAAAAFKAVLSRTPGDYSSSVKLCHALLQLGETTAARPIAEAVLAMEPSHPLGDLLVGVTLALEGNEDLSAEHLRRARQSGASMVPILLRIGWVHLLFARPKEAEDAFLDVIEKDNKIAEAHTGLGVSLHAQGRNDEAERSLRRAIVLEFHNPVAHVHLGRVLAKLGDIREAIKALRIALAQQPGSAESKTLLAQLERNLALGAVAQERVSDKSSPL